MDSKVRIFICNIILLILLGFFLFKEQDAVSTDLEITVVYGGNWNNEQGNMAQLYYKTQDGGFSEHDSQTKTILNQEVTFVFDEYDMKNVEIRLDPTTYPMVFDIEEIDILYKGKYQRVLTGEEFQSYVMQMVDCEYDEITGEYTAITNDPYMMLSKRFIHDIKSMSGTSELVKTLGKEGYWWFVHILVFAIVTFFAVIQGFVRNEGSGGKSIADKVRFAFVYLLLCIGAMAAYGEHYLENEFGGVSLGQMLFHLHTPLDGAGTETFNSLIVIFVAIIVVCTLVLSAGNLILRRIGKNKGFISGMLILGMIFLIPALIRFINYFDVINYVKYANEKTELYEKYYVDGREIELTFPEEKRNLIFIFLESMEVTFSDQESGGAMSVDIIPELNALAKENICFAGGDELNGSHVMPGASFTMGSLVANTSGVPINEKLVSNDTLYGYWESQNNYLPGAWTIGDVLHEEGYNQMFMIGSDGKFAGRSSYFRGHGQYEVYDYYAAIEDERIAEDYYVWWGYEDQKLFAYAKEEIIELAAQEEPFNLTMLTVDTHFTDGHFCEQCQNEFDYQYSNVMACSSRQVTEFVSWVQQQEFYDNTTIVIVGDHLTPNTTYLDKVGVDIMTYVRRNYCTIINPAEGCKDSEEMRNYTAMDIYPTTLAAMGVSIEGERLGLGVNLFSDEPTLYEEFGMEVLSEELIKNSDFYTERLLYGE